VQEKMLSYTKQEVMEICKKYFTNDNRLHVIALPEKK
jgi:predicted Zn-dependent peptidase